MQSNLDQQSAFRSFLHARVPVGPRGRVLPHWYQAFFYPGVPLLGALYAAGFLASLAVYYYPAGGDGGHGPYYGWCAFLTAAHGAFMPWAWEGVKGVRDAAAPPRRNEAALRKWLVVSLVRAFVADGPAWVCAVLGLMACLK